MPALETEYREGIEAFFAARLELVKPGRSRMTVSEWAEAKRVLPRGLSSVPGAYRFRTTPYMREPCDCFSETSPVQKIAIIKGARVGASVGLIENALGYIIDQSSGGVLYMSGDKISAEQSSEIRLDAMLSGAGLADRIYAQTEKKAGKATGNTKSLKQWAGGFAVICGPNVAARLRAFGVRYIFFDDLEAFPLDCQGEGSPIMLGTRRSDEFESSRKIAYISTPADDETSQIKVYFAAGDQRHYQIPCPACGHFQVIRWRDDDGAYRLHFDVDKLGHLVPDSVFYECENEACKAHIVNSQKSLFLPLGKWVPTAVPEEPNFRSYHIPSLLSPFRSWEDICREFIKTKGDTARLKVFVNTVLGETWINKTAPVVRPEIVQARRENYSAGSLPVDHRALFVTAGIDVMKEHIDLFLCGWARDKEAYAIEHDIFFQDDCSDIHGPAWKSLADALQKSRGLPVLAVFIDSGWATSSIYEWVSRFGSPLIHAIMGDSNVGRGGGRSIFTAAAARGAGIQRLDLNTDFLKDELMSMLRIGTPDGLPPREGLPGYIHWPAEFSSAWFQQLTAETKIAKGGRMQWVQHGANHALDLFVYALGAVYKIFAERAEIEKGEGMENYTWPDFWKWAKTNLAVLKQRGWV